MSDVNIDAVILIVEKSNLQMKYHEPGNEQRRAL